MNLAQTILENRKSEIQSHIDLIKQYDISLIEEKLVPNYTYKIDSCQYSIIKACTYILLYNMIEAVIVKSFEDLENNISSTIRTLDELTENYQKEWVKTSFHKHKGDELSKLLFIVNDLYNQRATGNNLCVKISRGGGGNWKLDEITSKMDNLNIKHNTIEHSIKKAVYEKLYNEEGAFDYVVELRNKLAHGEISFDYCGKDTTVEKLETIFTAISKYLDSIVQCFQLFIKHKKYKSDYSRPEI